MRMGFAHQWLLLSLLCVSIVSIAAAVEVHFWPQPQSVEWGPGPAIPLSKLFSIAAPENHVLSLAVKRCHELLQREHWLSESTGFSQCRHELTKLEICVADLTAPLQHGEDKSYSLHVTGCEGVSATLSSAIVWGALHGLEMFSQLFIWRNPTRFIPHDVRITDAPNFPPRGILLDTSRNFFPVKAILRALRAMAYNKMNVLHWHVTDSHSFPLELPREPELARRGADGVRERYSAKDVARVVAFGRVRGVRVVPEIDMPVQGAEFNVPVAQQGIVYIDEGDKITKKVLDASDVVGSTHWRYNLMAHGMLLFLLLPPSSSNFKFDASTTSKTRQRCIYKQLNK